MARAEAYRHLVVARAGGGCEYCRLLQAAAGVTFHIEHLVPRSRGGRTALNNLALSCPGCNLAKAERTTGEDDNGAIQPLFNPRHFEPWLLGWHLHFALHRESGIIIARTAIGQATVTTLNMNDPLRLLALGVVYAFVDTAYSLSGRVFLGRWPLLISLMEAVFIGLLCYYDTGLESAFRYYYFLSLICCAIRHTPRVTYLTWALHAASYSGLFLAEPETERALAPWLMTLVVLGWVAWASAALALLLKHVGDHLGRLNAALEANQALLEERIAERTRELQEAQAHVLHQEKMAAFGLLAAGIAHEVGNPLTSISSLVQMLQRREGDPYTLDKLGLISGQLQRIRGTLRELIEFSRPASGARTRVGLGDVLGEALN